MDYLNTILMPEINSTPNFTLEINFWWPHPRGGGPPHGGCGIKNRGSGGDAGVWEGGGAPPPPTQTTFSTVGGLTSVRAVGHKKNLR